MPRIYVDYEDMLSANNAVKALRENGFKDAHLDAMDNFSYEFGEDLSPMRARRLGSLSSLVLKSRRYAYDTGKGPLIAASPMVSGIGSSEGTAPHSSTRMSVNVDDKRMEEFKNVIGKFGGEITELQNTNLT